MGLVIEIVILCLFFWLVCFLNTGSDVLNRNNIASYSDEVQKKINGKVIKPAYLKLFVGNLITYLIFFFIFGLFIRTDSFLENFVKLLLLGEVFNLFDLIVIDFIWFRNTKRVRFSKMPDKSNYRGMKRHFFAFLRAIPLFAIVAIVDGFILSLF